MRFLNFLGLEQGSRIILRARNQIADNFQRIYWQHVWDYFSDVLALPIGWSSWQVPGWSAP